MYIFTRTRPFEGRNPKEAIEASVQIAEMVTEVTGNQVSVWSSLYHPMGNAITWSARVETLAQYEAMSDKVMSSDKVMKQLAKVSDLMPGAMIDNMVQVVAGSLGPKPAKYVTIVQGQAANSHQREAVAWGADLAVKAGRAMDIPVVFAMGVFGNYGSMSWISSVEDADGLDDTRGKLIANETLQALIDEGGHLVQPYATQILLRRIN